MSKATSGISPKSPRATKSDLDTRLNSVEALRTQEQGTTLGEPVRLRSKRLSGGRRSLYLDIYWAGKRSYHFLKLYLLPETDAETRTYNAMMLKTAYILKAQKLLALMADGLQLERDANKTGLPTVAGGLAPKGTLADLGPLPGMGALAETGGLAGMGSLAGTAALSGMEPLSVARARPTGNRMQKSLKLTDWMTAYRQQQELKGRIGTWQIAHTADLLVHYKGPDVTLGMVDKAFCLGFAEFLLHSYKTKCGKPISRVTASNYFGRLNSALNAAVRGELLAKNPMEKLDECEKIRATARRRNYLTIDEVKRLIDTDCPHPVVKRAFLFSCFCGLRLGDIQALKWRDFTEEQGRWRIDMVMRKTREPLYLPVSEQARRWLPDGGNTEPMESVASMASPGVAGTMDATESAGMTGVASAGVAGETATAVAEADADADTDADAFVFKLPSCVYINVVLKRWAQAAGIRKNLHFHVARHTFATMMLTLGADLYTTSKLLGHTDIGTTQIYAQIINQKKDAAVDLVNAVFSG